MVAHVIDARHRSVPITSANRSLDEWRFGYPVISDEVGGFAGLLAGLYPRAQRRTSLPRYATRRFCRWISWRRTPRSLTTSLAVAHVNFAQPVFTLCTAALLPSLTAFSKAADARLIRGTPRIRSSK